MHILLVQIFSVGNTIINQPLGRQYFYFSCKNEKITTILFIKVKANITTVDVGG